MRRIAFVPLAAALAALTAGTVAAQPPAPPAKQGAPKPERLADGKPNWTGFWTPVVGLMDRNYGPGFKAAPPPTSGATGPQVAAAPTSPMLSPYKERYAKLVADAAAGKVTLDPVALCLPAGMPRVMGAIYGLELLQTPGQVTITGEWGGVQRRIWLDGRKHPDPEEVLPTYSGHSIGRWEGDVLVVDTQQIRDDVPLDQSGLMHTERMRITERFRSTGPGLLEDEITIIDPEVYSAPWTTTRRYRYRPELNLQEYVCEENNRNVGANGAPEFKQ